MALGYFIAPYKEHRPGRLVCSMDDASSDIGREWVETPIGDDKALVCVNATPAQLANLATTYQRTTKPDDVLAAHTAKSPPRLSQSLRQEATIDVRPRIAALVAQADAEGYVRLSDPWNISTAKLLVALGDLGYGLDRVSTGTFPTTGLLDAFTRANSASSPGPGWTTYGGFVTAGVSSNQFYDPNSPGSDNGNYWTSAFSSADQEAYAVIPTVTIDTTYWGVNVRAVNPASSTTRDSHWVEVERNEATFNIYTETDNVFSIIGSTTAQTFSSGDSFGLEAIGTVLTAYRKTAGSWSAKVTRTAVYTAAGNIGAFIFSGTGGGIHFLDDFSGGNVVTGPPPVYPTLYDYSKFPKAKLARV